MKIASLFIVLAHNSFGQFNPQVRHVPNSSYSSETADIPLCGHGLVPIFCSGIWLCADHQDCPAAHWGASNLGCHPRGITSYPGVQSRPIWLQTSSGGSYCDIPLCLCPIVDQCPSELEDESQVEDLEARGNSQIESGRNTQSVSQSQVEPRSNMKPVHSKQWEDQEITQAPQNQEFEDDELAEGQKKSQQQLQESYEDRSCEEESVEETKENKSINSFELTDFTEEIVGDGVGGERRRVPLNAVYTALLNA